MSSLWTLDEAVGSHEMIYSPLVLNLRQEMDLGRRLGFKSESDRITQGPPQWPKSAGVQNSFSSWGYNGGLGGWGWGGLKLHTHVCTFMQQLNETAASVLLQRWEGPRGNPSEATCR